MSRFYLIMVILETHVSNLHDQDFTRNTCFELFLSTQFKNTDTRNTCFSTITVKYQKHVYWEVILAHILFIFFYFCSNLWLIFIIILSYQHDKSRILSENILNAATSVFVVYTLKCPFNLWFASLWSSLSSCSYIFLLIIYFQFVCCVIRCVPLIFTCQIGYYCTYKCTKNTVSRFNI